MIPLLYLCPVSDQARRGPKCDVCQLTPCPSPPPWQPVVETICDLTESRATSCPVTPKTPSPLLHVTQTIITVRAPMSQEGIIFVCLACHLYMFCAATPSLSGNRCTYTHTPLLLSPSDFSSLTFVWPGKTRTCAERH